MKLCDVNVWLGLVLGAHKHHGDVRRWLNTQNDLGSVLLCRYTQQALLRLLTTASILRPYGLAALTNEQAWEAYHTLQEDDRLAMVEEPPGIEIAYEQFSSRPSPSPKLWMDAYLAAFAMTAGYQLVTLDQAYRQFDDVDLLVLG